VTGGTRLGLAGVLLVAALVAAGCQGDGGSEGPIETFADRDLTKPGTLRVCTEATRPPMAYRGADGILRGFEVDLLGEIAERNELEPVWVETTHETLLDSLADGKCDLIASALTVRFAQQQRVAEFPYLTAPIGMLVREEERAPVALGLCGRPLGALSGTLEEELAGTYSQECVGAGRQPVDVVVTQSTDDGLAKLEEKKIDVLLDDRPVTDWFARRRTDVFDDGGTLSSQDNVVYAIGYGIGKNTLFSGIQGSLFELNRDGTVPELIHRWGLEDTGVELLRLS
jgi:polar amino acid transport system substrate-binding protein